MMSSAASPKRSLKNKTGTIEVPNYESDGFREVWRTNGP